MQYQPKPIAPLMIAGKNYLTQDKFGNTVVNTPKLVRDFKRMDDASQKAARDELAEYARLQAKQANQRLRRLETTLAVPDLTGKKAEAYAAQFPNIDYTLKSAPAYGAAEKLIDNLSGGKATLVRFRERTKTMDWMELINQTEATTQFLRLKTSNVKQAKEGESGRIKAIEKFINDQGGVIDYDKDGKEILRKVSYAEIYSIVRSKAVSTKFEGYDYMTMVQRTTELKNAAGGSMSDLAPKLQPDGEYAEATTEEKLEALRDEIAKKNFANKQQTAQVKKYYKPSKTPSKAEYNKNQQKKAARKYNKVGNKFNKLAQKANKRKPKKPRKKK